MTEEQSLETNPVKVIRAHCLDCAYNAAEVARCPCTKCNLWPFRFGKNPYRKRKEYTEEELAKRREQFAKNMAKNTDKLPEQKI